MNWYATDGVLLVGLLATAYYAYHAIPENLNYIRNLSACPEQTGPGPRKQLQKDAENAISIETLRVLSQGHSYDLRASTIKIVASRTLKSRAKKLLLQDLESRDEDRRYKAICAIWMLMYNPSLQGKNLMNHFLNYDFFYSLVTALRNVLADHPKGQRPQDLDAGDSHQSESKIPPSPIKPPIRPYHETSLMMILRALLETPMPRGAPSVYSNSAMCALAAGLVDRWLRDYPFPCALPENAKYNFKKSDVVSLLEARAWGKDDDLMASIVSHISMTGLGKKQLRDAGLRASSYTEIEHLENTVSRWKHFPTRLDMSETDQDVHMINGESTAGTAPAPVVPVSWDDLDEDVPRSRSHELSQEEEALRRRRREAVVVAEPGVPLSRDNILQRTDSGSDWRPPPDSDTANESSSTPAPSGTAAPPVELELSIDFEFRFERLTRPLTNLQMDLQDLRQEAVDSRALGTDDVLNRFSTLLYRINNFTTHVERCIAGWGLPHNQQDRFLDRLRAITDTIREQEEEFAALATNSSETAPGPS